MKYNAKYDRWFTKGGLVFRYDEKNDKLVCCSVSNAHGYGVISLNHKNYLVHRIIWEIFNGNIPIGHVIDHIDGNKMNNNLENLRSVTQKENVNNPITLSKTKNNQKEWYSLHKSPTYGKQYSEFGKLFYNQFKMAASDNLKFYRKEYDWYKRHGHCRWEVLDEHN